MSAFDDAFAYLFQNEGSRFTNDPDDSGGPTRFGITKEALEAFVGHPVGLTEIENLTVETAKTFYREVFWNDLACDRMTNPAIAIALFDTGVLYGVGTASCFAQECINGIGNYGLKIDGILGDKSIEALNAVLTDPSTDEFLMLFRSMILDHVNRVIRANPKNEKYRAGWTKRADRLLSLGSIKNTEVLT